MQKVIFNPQEEFDTALRERHFSNATTYLDALVKRSGVDIEENRKTVQEYYRLKEDLKSLMRKRNWLRFFSRADVHYRDPDSAGDLENDSQDTGAETGDRNSRSKGGAAAPVGLSANAAAEQLVYPAGCPAADRGYSSADPVS